MRLWLVAAMALVLNHSLGQRDAYQFKFGLMARVVVGHPVVYLETNQIEDSRSSYLHGFSIAQDGNQFSYTTSFGFQNH